MLRVLLYFLPYKKRLLIVSMILIKLQILNFLLNVVKNGLEIKFILNGKNFIKNYYN